MFLEDALLMPCERVELQRIVLAAASACLSDRPREQRAAHERTLVPAGRVWTIHANSVDAFSSSAVGLPFQAGEE